MLIRSRAAATCLGFLISEISKILTPRNLSFCGAGRRGPFACPAAGVGSGGNPCAPQSIRPFGISTDMNSRLPYTDTSPCPPGHTIEVTNDVLAGYWTTVKYSATMEPTRVAELLERTDKLIRAVKFAREEANGLEIDQAKAEVP